MKPVVSTRLSGMKKDPRTKPMASIKTVSQRLLETPKPMKRMGRT